MSDHPNMLRERHFNFGSNWLAYSTRAFNEAAFQKAQSSLATLIGRASISGKTFLDIGSGSGIFSLAARTLGAKQVTGIDISPESVKSAQMNAKHLGIEGVTFLQKDILSVRAATLGQYDIVYSWGVLHHTGRMWEAIERTADFVKGHGLLVIAIYSRHWSSPLWRAIKYLYVTSPRPIQQAMTYIFYALVYTLKLVVTRTDPLQRRRGMNFYYDVVDWIGGYPYEYASAQEIITFLQKRSFRLLNVTYAPLPTGNNEFVFQKTMGKTDAATTPASATPTST